MSGQLFRKTSMERISSPEQLNHYVRVANPGVWLVLGALILLLTGICVWGICGRLNTTLDTAGVCENGVFTCYIKERDIVSIKKGMEITVSGESCVVSDISLTPVEAGGEVEPYLLHLGGFQAGEWLYEVTADTALPDGAYEAAVTIESVSPISLIWGG